MFKRDRVVGYAALNQRGVDHRRWWERVPEPLTHIALRVWALLPGVIRRPLIPVGDWINPGHTVTADPVDGPDTVAGVAELRAEGFEPVEFFTGMVDVALYWPKQHRRSVAETRSWWLDEPNLGERLWLIRSPWPSLSLTDVFAVLWRWVERDRTLDPDVRTARIIEVLAWDESTALEQLRS